MITGHISALHVIVSVRFRRAGQPDIVIEFVVDTGFTGFLCLSQRAVTALGLPFRHYQEVTLADDSATLLPVHDAIISWDGQDREVKVLAAGKRPLLGTALLDGCEMLSQFREDGLVTITALKPGE
jgi:clan AA aspartic protease